MRLDKPSVPPELRGAVVEAANELEVAESAASDARETAESIVSRLKSELTKG